MSGPLRVLVVEDYPDGSESLCTLVELWGHDCRTAPDGPAGVDLALAWRPNAAVIDLGLPGIDGLEVSRRLRPALGLDVLLVALAAHNDDGPSRAAGFDRHLIKPADPAVLKRLLDSQAALVRWEAGDDR
jgi:CheY-like chemotaxis protein